MLAYVVDDVQRRHYLVAVSMTTPQNQIDEVVCLIYRFLDGVVVPVTTTSTPTMATIVMLVEAPSAAAIVTL